MKMKLITILLIIQCINLYSDIIPQYELDFIRNEEETIKNNNLISKEQAIEAVYQRLITCYSKYKPSELIQLLSSADVILVENITPIDDRKASFVKYYYSVHAKFKNGNILVVDSINAQTGESEDATIMDINNKEEFITLLSRNEVINYIKKYIDFPEDSLFIIRAIYDYNFYNRISFSTLARNWRYCITIQNGTFKSPSFPAGINTISITPYVRCFNGKREEATPENGFIPMYKHRLFTYQNTDINQESNITKGHVIENKLLQNKYIGID